MWLLHVTMKTSLEAYKLRFKEASRTLPNTIQLLSTTTHTNICSKIHLAIEWERIEISSRKLDIPRKHFTEKVMAPHSSTLAWKIPWMEKPGGLQSMGSLRVGHDWATSLSLFTFIHWRRKWQPTPLFLPGESQGWGSLVAAVCGVAQSWTRLKWFSSSSREHFIQRWAQQRTETVGPNRSRRY